MDGGLWEKTAKRHIYTYMQGEEDGDQYHAPRSGGTSSCIKDLPWCGSCLDQLVGMASSLASLLLTMARLLVLVGDAQGNFLVGLGLRFRKSCESETEKAYDGHFYTCVSVLQQTFLLVYHTYIGLECLQCLSFTHD